MRLPTNRTFNRAGRYPPFKRSPCPPPPGRLTSWVSLASSPRQRGTPDVRARRLLQRVRPARRREGRCRKAVFEFVDRSTEDELALRNNRAAFEKIKLTHRALVDVSGRSTKTTLFGKEIALPMAIAPTGAAGLCWHEGELELAKAAAKTKIPFTLATGAMTSMEKIAREANFRLWFQLYVWKQRELSYQLIERAKNNGFEALIVTTDTIVPPNREYNAKNGSCCRSIRPCASPATSCSSRRGSPPCC